MKTSYPKDKINVLLFEGIHKVCKKEFSAAGYKSVKILPKSYTGKELLDAVKDAHIIGVRSKTQLTKKVLNAAEKLHAVGCFCIGTNQVDLDEASRLGIPVFNSPYSNTRSVAELVLAEAIMLLRRIPERDKAAHEGKWLKDASGSYELRGKTMGIIGYGHIGSQVSVLGESLGLNVQYFDVAPKLPMGNAKSVKSLKELITTSDIITLHVPANETTENMINANTVKYFKKGSILLNLSRGNVVDIEVIKKALKSKQIAGAAFDVFPKEPKSKTDSFISELQGLNNVILTPHIGGSTQEAQYNIGIDVSNKLISFMDKGVTVGSNSVPELNLPVQFETHRILHIHKNVPGMLSKINSLLSKKKINILGQYLKTNEQIGYVVLDVESKASAKAINEVKNIKGTIRCRILY